MVIDSSEPQEALSLGAVFGGSPEVDGQWRPEIQRLMSAVIAFREGVRSPLSVNVVFHVEGRLLPPLEFEGVRTGTFSRKRMLLMVQAAVPTEPVDDRRGVLLALLSDAVTAAEALAARRKVASSLPEIREIIDAVALDADHRPRERT